MPIDHKESSTVLSQRNQYQKGGIGRWFWDYRDDRVFSFIQKKHHKIVDIGCGEGITLEKLIRLFPEKDITGIDVLPENVRICREHNLPVSLDSVYNSKIEENSVDLCILSEVIEHLDDSDSAIESIRKILKPRGQLIIVFPHDRIFKISRILFLKFKEAFADPGHVHQFTPRNMKKILGQKGFKTKKIINTPFKFWFLSLHCIMLAQKQ